MMRIKEARECLNIAVGDIRFRKKNIDINEFPQLFRMFLSFEEGHDWKYKAGELVVRHPNLAEMALIYISIRSADATVDEARKIVNSMRMFEASSLASILWYRLSILNGGKSKFLRIFGRALLKMFTGAW